MANDEPGAAATVGPRHVAIDLTPILPGGESGGAKLVALTLARLLGRVAPDCRFTLLTLGRTHDDLAMLEAENVRRLQVDAEPGTPDEAAADSEVGGSAQNRRARLLRDIGADLLFCPLTAPTFFDPNVPVASVVYDLQHVRYPMFFTAAERAVRDRQLAATARVADRIVCISDFTRSALIQHTRVPDERVLTIPVAHSGSLNRSTRRPDSGIVDRLGIQAGRFLLYPANFWPHKNHRLLLAALALYRACHSQSDLVLVCTGAPGRHMDEVRDAARFAGVAEWVRFPGFVTETELAALMQASLAVIFPSLYEGFGMPVLEAMASGTPVLSSNAASLPEVAGDAALFFDPNRPVEMLAAIERIERDSELRTELVGRGRARLAAFDDAEQMTLRYLDVFREVVSTPRALVDRLQGVDADGWTGERVIITYGPGSRERHLDAVLTAPPWLPFGEVCADVLVNGSDEVTETISIRPRQRVRIRQPLARDGGSVDIVFDRVFRPRAHGLGDDSRVLGCVVQACSIIGDPVSVDLLADVRWADPVGAGPGIGGDAQHGCPARS